MGSIGGIHHAQPISTAWLETQLINIRAGLAIDDPMKTAEPRPTLQQHFDRLIRRRNSAVDSTESGIGPIDGCRRMPLRRAILIGIRNANAAPAGPLGVVQ